MSHAAWIGLLALLGAGALRGRLAAGAASGLLAGGAILLILGVLHLIGWSAHSALVITLAGCSLAALVLERYWRRREPRLAVWLGEIAVGCAAGAVVVIWRQDKPNVAGGATFAPDALESATLWMMAAGFGVAGAALRDGSRIWVALALVGAALAGWSEPWLASVDSIAPTGVLSLGILALVGIMAPSAARWGFRRRAWLTDPERLTDPRPDLAPICAAVTLLALASGVLAMRCLGAAGTAPGLGLAAWASFSAAYAAGWRFSAEAGLALVALAITTAVMALAAEPLPHGRGSDQSVAPAVIAAANSGLIFLWLGRSWAQLVRDGEAFTLAGRLAGSASAAAAGCLIVCSIWFVATWPAAGGLAASQAPGWALAAAILSLAWAAAVLRRAGRGVENATGGGGAGLLATGLAVFMAGNGLGLAGGGEPIFWVSLGASGWVILLLTLGRERVCGWACQAYIWGLLPVVGFGAALDGGLNRHEGAALLLMVAAALASCLARGVESAGRPPSAAADDRGQFIAG